MLTRFRQVFGVVLLVLLFAACSGGGCSGCSGCGGTTPLAGGFPKEKAIDNAGAVRLSRQGLDFLEQNLPGIAAQIANAKDGKLAIAIPETASGDNVVCPGGPDLAANPPKCLAEVNLGASSFRLDALNPSSLDIRAVLPLKVVNTPVRAKVGITLTVNVAYGDNTDCTDGRATASPHNLPVRISVPLVEETTAPRTGYTKIDVDNATVDLSGISEDQVKICANCGFADFICNPVLNLAKGLVVDQIKAQLDAQVKSLLRSQLCTKPTANVDPPCPTGSKPSGTGTDATCNYDSAPGKCVSMLLGTDAHIELGGFLASISPGSQGALDFGFAAGGPMKAAPFAAPDGQGRTPNGVSLGFVGGVIPKPPSKCVPDSSTEIPLPTGIPVPDELVPAQPEAQGTPHMKLALAGRFLQYSLGSVYRSGLLCLGTSTEQIDMLKTGLLSLLIPSIKQLTFEQGDAAAAIATRPQAPPTLVLGGGTNIATDPLLKLTLPKFAVDFYIWSHDRYVRAFTFQADLTVPVNLQAGKDPVKNPKGGIVPTLGDIAVANGQVTNTELLMEDPAQVAGALSGLLGGLSKQLLGGGIAPIDLSSALASLGLGVEVNQIGKLTQGTDDFLTVSATLSKTTNALVEADTKARLVAKVVDAAHMQLATYAKDALPKLELDVASSLDDGKHAVEYTWWIDNGTRALWAPVSGGRLVVQDDQLLLQGRHVLHVASRLVGQASSEDASPADVPFVIDALAPFVTTTKDGAQVKVSAWDVVSARDALRARYRLDDGATSEWKPLADVATIDAAGASRVDVEVQDEEGNVQRVSQPLVRGRADGSLEGAGSGCGCQTPGTRASSSEALAIALSVLGLGFVVLRRRQSSRAAVLAIGSLGVVAASSQGCSCGSEEGAPQGCGADCLQECRPALSPGMPGSYTSVAKAKDGTIWVAGYNDALLEDGDARLWGDLVVGKYDLGRQKVEWTTVDGVPKRETGCPDYDRTGWRGGESDSGDDVGLWTSIQVNDEGVPVVSYYDATNKRLKVATRDGDGWVTFVLKESSGADIGRYSKMVLADGKPVVAYLHVEPGNGGRTRSKLVVARASTASPKSASDFAFEDVNVDEEGPCRAGECPGGQECVKATGACTPTIGGCQPACTAGSQACVSVDGKATCEAVMGTVTTYPRAVGAYVSMAASPGGLGIVAYDAVRGNLLGFAEKSGAWTKTLLDGETGNRADKTAVDTGDVGIAASLFIDNATTWHVTYVNGIDETLRYLRVDAGKPPTKSEIVDDGTTVDGKPFADGKHVVGDDSTVHANGDAVVVYYQDATAGVLRRATGTPDGAGRKWDLRTIAQPNRFAGFFPQVVPGEDKVANWWRETNRGARTVLGDVSIVSP